MAADLYPTYVLMAQAAAGGAADDTVTADDLVVTGPSAVLPARFDVTGFAAGAVAAAGVAAARLLAARRDIPPAGVTIDTRAACAAFAAEGLFTPIGWPRPELWDPIAGNYRTSDGWIRLHTNYPYHRAVAERVLGGQDRDAIEKAAAGWPGEELQAAIVDAGGAAAVMHDRSGWLASAPGRATAGELAVTVESRPGDAVPAWRGGIEPARPFGGIRVLDLTRVIAGPDCTKFLAAYGADVLRIDPPGFAEVASLLPETTVGKRTAALDLATPADRAIFEELVRGADVLVTGYRAGAMTGLGYPDDVLAALNPSLVIASLTAYGDSGPWGTRRGFDSLVQMSSGIAAAGATWLGRDDPVPLPVQALDHATGYLLAAAIARALTRQLTTGVLDRIRASLIGAANLLWRLPEPSSQPPRPNPADFTLVDTATAWGPARRVPIPAVIDGTAAEWTIDAGPLGRHRPEWITR